MTSIDPHRDAYLSAVASAARYWMTGDARSDRVEGVPMREYVAASLTLVALLVDNLARKAGRDPLALLDEITTEMLAAYYRPEDNDDD